MSFNFQLDPSSTQTKLQQLIHAITEAISNGELHEADFLPSVNSLSKSSGLSRDTIFKAYTKLKQQSVISSTPTKGYFVRNESFKVFVLLDNFSAFKEQLYTSFRESLPDNYVVDLLFHHYNPDVFEQLILNSLGRCSMYLVMNINHDRLEKVVKKIDSNKLLILDMGTPDVPEIAYLNQNFSKAVDECLYAGLERIKKYQQFNLVFPDVTPHPRETIIAFTEFCEKNNLKYSVIQRFKDFPLAAGQAFFAIKDDDLVEIVKACRSRDLTLGKDVGLISYNDTPMKEIVSYGITTISIDFKEMGEKVAHFIQSKEKVFETLSTRLTLRNSL